MATSSSGGQVNSLKSKALSNLRWQRVVLKISGAALTGSDTCNIDPKVCGMNVPQKEKQLWYDYIYVCGNFDSIFWLMTLVFTE